MGAQLVPNRGASGTNSSSELSMFLKSHLNTPYGEWSEADQQKFAYLLTVTEKGTLSTDDEYVASKIMEDIFTPPIASGYIERFNYDDGSKPFTPPYENATRFNITHNPLDIAGSGILHQFEPVQTEDPVLHFMKSRSPGVFESLTGYNASIQRGYSMATMNNGFLAERSQNFYFSDEKDPFRANNVSIYK